MASINTNYGALVATQSLAATSRELETVQNRVTTGRKVDSAKDNGAIWAIAQNQKGQMMALNANINALQRTQSINDVGLAAGDSIMEALNEMKALIAEPASTARTSDINALRDEVIAAAAAANFDGVNAFGAGLAHGFTAGTSPDSAAIEAAITASTTALQTLGTASKSAERSLAFTVKLQDALEAGLGNLVDADLAKESARLTALQTKQQLGVQALGIANQSSSILLGLFR